MKIMNEQEILDLACDLSTIAIALAYTRENQQAFKVYVDKLNPMPDNVRESDLTPLFDRLIEEHRVRAMILMRLSVGAKDIEAVIDSVLNSPFNTDNDAGLDDNLIEVQRLGMPDK